jgi:hypothetical protein
LPTDTYKGQPWLCRVRRAVFNCKIDDRCAGTWIIHTANKSLDKIGVYTQSKMLGTIVKFDDLKVYEMKSALQ